jgi:ribonuclease P protein component
VTATAAPASNPAAPRPQLWRLSDRSSFQELRRHGRRARRGPVTVTWLADGPTQPRAGFVVGKAAGGAVVRNRIKRRLRAGLRELQAGDRLPLGTYLVAAGPEAASMPWSALVSELTEAVTAATGGTTA